MISCNNGISHSFLHGAKPNAKLSLSPVPWYAASRRIWSCRQKSHMVPWTSKLGDHAPQTLSETLQGAWVERMSPKPAAVDQAGNKTIQHLTASRGHSASYPLAILTICLRHPYHGFVQCVAARTRQGPPKPLPANLLNTE